MANPTALAPTTNESIKNTIINNNFQDVSDRFRTNIILDDTGTARMVIGKLPDGRYGALISIEGVDALTADDDQLILSPDFRFARETWLPLHPQWDNSWTTSTSYQAVSGSFAAVDFDDWQTHNIYLEVIGKVDGGTGFYHLYNITAAAIVANSEISTTSTTPVRLRSIALTKPTGINVFRLQHKLTGGGGGDFVNSVMSRIVFTA